MMIALFLLAISVAVFIYAIPREDAITYSGRRCGHNDKNLMPNEVAHSWTIRSSRLKGKTVLSCPTGVVTPVQAGRLIEYLIEMYPVTPNGSDVDIEIRTDNELRVIIDFGHICPRHLNQRAQDKLIRTLLDQVFIYHLVKEWPADQRRFSYSTTKKLVEDSVSQKGHV